MERGHKEDKEIHEPLREEEEKRPCAVARLLLRRDEPLEGNVVKVTETEHVPEQKAPPHLGSGSPGEREPEGQGAQPRYYVHPAVAQDARSRGLPDGQAVLPLDVVLEEGQPPAAEAHDHEGHDERGYADLSHFVHENC